MAQITPRIKTTTGSLLQWQLSLFYWALHIDTLLARCVQLSVNFLSHCSVFPSLSIFFKLTLQDHPCKKFFFVTEKFCSLVFLLMFHYHHFVFAILTHWWHCNENTKLLFYLINNSKLTVSYLDKPHITKNKTVLFVVIDPTSSIPDADFPGNSIRTHVKIIFPAFEC